MAEIPITIIFAIALVIVAFISYYLGKVITNLRWKSHLPKIQRLTAEKQRSTIKGKLTETFAPFLPNFPFKPSECKFIGDPIDYLVFEGLDERDIKAIHLLEVKSQNSKLSKHQKQIKEILDNLKSEDVTFREFNFRD